MKAKTKVLAFAAALALLIGVSATALAATVHYNDSSVTGGSAEWQAWCDEWEALSGDFTQVSLTPGQE